MAEAIAVVASVVAIVQITDRVIDLCKYYIQTAEDASRDLRTILVETSTLKTTLQNVEFLIAWDNGTSTLASTLSGEEGPIKGCQRSITELEKLFPSVNFQTKEQSRSKKQKVKATWTALAWPLKESKARKLLEEITRYKTTITLAITTESIQDLRDIKRKATEMHSILTDSQRQEVYRWLQQTDPSPLHNQARKNYEPGTGDWMLRSPEWANWLDAKQRSLWIHGIPGAGKTILMSYLVEQIKQHCKHIRPGKCAYVYYYCYFAHDQDETAPLLRWLLNQLCRQADVVPDTVFTMYKYGGEPGVVELLGALEDILEMFEVTYVVVDALDESSLPREELLRTLQGIATSPRFEKLQLLTSSREYIDIERFMSQFSMSISMANPFVEDDIRVYVRSLLRSSNKFRRWPQELLDEVEQTISTGAKGMFRWAVCQLDILQRLNCERRVVEKALKNLPKTLDESYDRILLAIPEEEQVIVHHILQWIHYHNELYDGQSIPCELLVQGVRKSTAKLSADHMERFYDTETLLEVCGCLISLVAENRTEIRGQETLGFSFAHYTVREYLDSNRVSPGSTAYSITYMKDLTQEVLGIVLHEAHSFKPNPLWEIGDDDSTHRIGTMAYVVEDFNVYCSASALLSLCKLQHEIAEQDTLYALGISLLDPSKPHFQILRDAAWCIRPLVEWFSRGDTYDAGQFWEVRWNAEPSNIDASLLLSLLFLTYRVWEGLPLAKKFLEGKTARSCLQTRLHFDYFAISEYDKLYYIFDGSVIEVFAQLRFAEEELELLLEYGMGLFDPSKILILIIGCRVVRREQSSEKVCLVQRLLGLGADPDMRGYRVSPLQIAVRRWDFVAVSKLLEGGADPNNTGNSNGVIWRERKIMTRFDCLHNASPLYICRHYKDIAIDFRKEDKEVNQPKIEAILLQYQAKAFKRSLPA